MDTDFQTENCLGTDYCLLTTVLHPSINADSSFVIPAQSLPPA